MKTYPGSIALVATLFVLIFSLTASTKPASAQTNLLANPGFESTDSSGAPVAWGGIWSRDPGEATASIDNTIAHSGSSSIKVISTEAKDWSYQQTQSMPVHPGEIYQLQGWFKCDSDQLTSISVTTRDGAGNVLDWQAGDADTGGTHDWTLVKSRLVIPDNCASVRFRLTGFGTGTVWFDDASMVKVGDITALHARWAGKHDRLQSKLLTVDFRPVTASFDITDRRNGRVWHQLAGAGNVVVTGVKVVGADELVIGLSDESLDLDVTATITLPADLPELRISLAGDGPISTPLQYPQRFAQAAGDDLVMPTNEGMLYPVDDPAVPTWNLQTYCGHGGLSMPWFGTIKTDGSGMVTLIRTPDDAEVDMNRDAQGVLFTQVNWDPSRGQFAYTRKITYAFFDKGGYVAQAKWYRAYAKSEGLFVTLAQKAKANPNVNLLLGAADVWTWAWGGHEAEICAEMKSIGMTHVLWSGAGPPDQVAQINQLGFLTGKYDQYQDVYPPDAPPAPLNVAWPSGLEMLQDGEYANGWLGSFTEPDGTVKKVQAGVCNSQVALGLERRIIPADLAKTPMTARFFDTDTASPWREDYSPVHPLSRSQDRDYRMQLLAYASQDLKLVNGSETGIDTAVPYLDYFEGMMSISEFRNPDSGRNMQDIIVPTQDILKFQVGAQYRIPLFELVYHECVVNYWYWGDYNNKEPAVWQRRDLFNILYATPPVYMFDRQFWDANKDQFAQSYKSIGPIARALGNTEMLSHEFLTPDHTVQRTRWANGASIYINLGDQPYALRGGKTVAPLGWLVEGLKT